jgi:hypothetical protein
MSPKQRGLALAASDAEITRKKIVYDAFEK